MVVAHRTDIPCRACHVINDWEHPDPRHAKKRCIEPFAPSANPQRLHDPERVEAFLKLNCNLLLKRECTAREKGDIITWLAVGLLAGWLAARVMKGGGYGLVGDMIVGLIGAVIGGLVLGLSVTGVTGLWGRIIVAIFGAWVLIAIFRFLGFGRTSI